MNLDIKILDTFFLSELQIEMSDDKFEELVSQKSDTTKPYYQRAKELIIRGLITSGKDSKLINSDKTLIGGGYKIDQKNSESRIFIVEKKGKVTLLWKGASSEYSFQWKAFRNKLAGVPKRTKK
jgi:hypothetical protein